MTPPFTVEQFFEIFVRYNDAVWPAPWIIGYALVVYPALGYFLGHHYPAAPTFGTPCPITLFTLGLLALAVGRPVRLLLVVPILWALVGTLAAFQFGMTEDLAMLMAASVSSWVVFRRQNREQLTPGPGVWPVLGHARARSELTRMFPAKS